MTEPLTPQQAAEMLRPTPLTFPRLEGQGPPMRGVQRALAGEPTQLTPLIDERWADSIRQIAAVAGVRPPAAPTTDARWN